MKRKHKFLVSLCVVVCVVAAIVGIVVIRNIKNNNRINSTSSVCNYEDEIKILNERFISDIIVYGEDVNFDKALNYRTITSITDDNLKSDSKYKYSFFIINDRTGNLKITDDEFMLCKKVCDENNINFYYIGKQYLEHLQEFGFHSGLYRDDLCGIGYILKPVIGRSVLQGIWSTTEEEISKKNKGLLGQLLAVSFVNNIIRVFEQ